MNQKVKNLIQKLGEAIHESVSESENIAGVVKNIREQGFDVLLMLEATIGLNEVDESEEAEADLELEEADGAFTRGDLNFLKSLRISLPNEAPVLEADLSLPAESSIRLRNDLSDPDVDPDPRPGRKPKRK